MSDSLTSDPITRVIASYWFPGLSLRLRFSQYGRQGAVCALRYRRSLWSSCHQADPPNFPNWMDQSQCTFAIVRVDTSLYAANQ
jgi:hypothetical protein